MQQGWMSEGSTPVTLQITVHTKELMRARTQGTVETWSQRMSIQQMFVSLTQNACHSVRR